MRVLVAGAGAIGGFIAARLSQAGHAVSVLARGAHLAALRESGRIVIETRGGRPEDAAVTALADPREAGPPEILFVTVKAHQVPALAPLLAEAAASAAMIIPCHNGVGWWYFQRHGGALDGRCLRALDPDAAIVRHLDPAKVVPTFAFKAAEVVAPGRVRHIEAASDSFPIGELDGRHTPRLAELAAAMSQAGLRAPPSDVRQQMWRKLLGNIWANPIGVLTGATVGATAAHPAARALALDLMREVVAVAGALGIAELGDLEQRLGRALEVGDAKASMLQDLERGRALEHAAIVGALVEIAGLVGVSVPRAATLAACLALLDATRGSAAWG
jgi:2-dehydropantoate 2-reductase